jgi:hypothetical protein
MQTESLNSITRSILINKQQPLHYYLPTLHRCIRAVRDIAKDINIGTNIKKVELDVTADRIQIPSDCINILKVYGLVGGKEKAFVFNNNVSTIRKEVGGNVVSYGEEDSSLPGYEKKYNFIKEQTSPWEYPQVFNNNYPTLKYEYNIDKENNELVLAYGSELEILYLTYMTSSISLTAANSVPYMAQEAIEAFVNYETAKEDGSPQSKVAILKDEYRLAKNNLKSAFNPIGTEEFLHFFNFN